MGGIFLYFVKLWKMLDIGLGFWEGEGGKQMAMLEGMKEGNCSVFDGEFLVHHDDFIHSRSLLPEKAKLTGLATLTRNHIHT